MRCNDEYQHKYFGSNLVHHFHICNKINSRNCRKQLIAEQLYFTLQYFMFMFNIKYYIINLWF